MAITTQMAGIQLNFERNSIDNNDEKKLELKNTSLYIFVLIQYTEMKQYINTIIDNFLRISCQFSDFFDNKLQMKF